MKKYEGWIGVFDSGVGGLSVLQELVKELPYENFYFFGDSANAPYGERPVEEIRKLAFAIADRMADAGCKAIVIACNTATSAAQNLIREKYEPKIPVIGIEPALKPAAEAHPNGKVLVLATPATIRLEKYQALSKRLDGQADFIPVMCPGMAGRIEKGHLDAEDLQSMINEQIGAYKGDVDAVVLGCTHYPFIKEQIRKTLGPVPLYDGGKGTARQVRRRLVENGILNREEGEKGQVVLDSSNTDEETKQLYRMLYETPVKE